MKCPKCGGKVRVVDNVQNSIDNETYRRRICESCNYNFYTSEMEIEPTERFFEDWSKNYRKHKN